MNILCVHIESASENDDRCGIEGWVDRDQSSGTGFLGDQHNTIAWAIEVRAGEHQKVWRVDCERVDAAIDALGVESAWEQTLTKQICDCVWLRLRHRTEHHAHQSQPVSRHFLISFLTRPSSSIRNER